MASVIEICNLALSNIRAGSINSLTEASLAAQQCKLKYPFIRDQVLRDAPWQFARKVEPLAQLSLDVFNWAYAYQYPSDCLNIRKLILNIENINQGTGDTVSRYRRPLESQLSLDTYAVQYEVQNEGGNKIIVANDAELRAEYTLRVEDPNLYDSQFIMALSHLLAAELAIPLVGAELGRQLKSDNLQLYGNYINSAVANNMNEQHQNTPDSEFITVR